MSISAERDDNILESDGAVVIQEPFVMEISQFSVYVEA